MEGGKQVGSASSITNELFGSKESSSSGVFGSIFAPSHKVPGRESLQSDSMEKKQDYSKESWNDKLGAPGDATKNYDSETQSTLNKDMSSLYQDQRVQPCHLSSSIYYGGQDIYSQPQNPQGSGINTAFKKDGGEDDSGSASRGNWWQGSLYY